MIGLKENVIIGKLIPAGTGMKRYRSVKLDTEMSNQLTIEEYDEDMELSLEEDTTEFDDAVAVSSDNE